jgi:hypothetical protein
MTLIIALAFGLLAAAPLAAQENASEELQQDEIGRTPPRLSYVDGQASFFRPGAQDWTQAQVNMPLSPGDQLYTGSPGNLEIQIGARAFVRGWANTQIGFENQEPDFLQFKVTSGHASFDLRSLESGRTLEVSTPNAAFTIDQAGYYRVDVMGERTDVITRRGGRVVVSPSDGTSFSIAPSEAVVIEGAEHPVISVTSAPPLDPWDNWNYARTEHFPTRRARACPARRLRRERSRPLRALASCSRLRPRVGADHGAGRMGPLQHGGLDPRPALRLDLGGHRPVGLGALPLRPLGPCEWFLVLGAGTDGVTTGLRPRPRGLFRRPPWPGGNWRNRSGRGLGGA